jgi:HSP20 family protein
MAARERRRSDQEEAPQMPNHLAERQITAEPVDQVTERMRRMAEQMFAGLGSPALLAEASAWTPLVDIEEGDDAYVLEAELPGVQRRDVNIELVGNELTITGELKERERKGIVRRRARRVGRFDYRVMLPSQVDDKNIEAKLSDGVLTVRVPKLEQGRRRIEVKAS